MWTERFLGYEEMIFLMRDKPDDLIKPVVKIED